MSDNTEDFDEEGWPITHAFQPMGMEEILSLRRERTPFVVEGLVRERATTVFLVDPRVHLQYFPMHLALSAVSGARLEPFGHSAGVPTLLCIADGDPFDDSKAFSGLFAHVGCPTQRARVGAGFRWCNGAAKNKRLPQLNTTNGQRALRQAMPEGCKLVVLVNPAKFLEETPDPMDSDRLDRFLVKLNNEGIAVAVIEPAMRPSSMASACITNHHDLIRLTLDVAAPVDYGEGFSLMRSKALAAGMPSTIHLWYQQVGELIQLGWDCGAEDRAAMGKQVEIWERQQRIERIQADCKARGVKVSQKTIADELGVDPATVTRDMKDIRVRHRRQEARRAETALNLDEQV